MEEDYANIREFLSFLIGKKLVDMTQTDLDELSEDNNNIILMFEGGGTLTFSIDSKVGFDYHNPELKD